MNTDTDALQKTLACRAAAVTLGLWVIVMTVVATTTHSLRSMMAASMSYGTCATLVGFAILAIGAARAAVLGRAEAREAPSGNH
jgi:hypothetical protein